MVFNNFVKGLSQVFLKLTNVSCLLTMASIKCPRRIFNNRTSVNNSMVQKIKPASFVHVIVESNIGPVSESFNWHSQQ